MVSVATVVAQQCRDIVLVRHQYVDVTVVIYIREGRTSTAVRRQFSQSRTFRNVDESAAFDVTQNEVGLGKSDGRVSQLRRKYVRDSSVFQGKAA